MQWCSGSSLLTRFWRVFLIVTLVAVSNSTLAAQAQEDPDLPSDPEAHLSSPPFSAKVNLYLPLVSTEANAQTDNAQLDPHTLDDYALAELARQRNEPPFQVDEAQAAATGPLNQVGQWGSVVSWPFAFASAASLPDGRIIAWGANNQRSFTGGTFTYSSIWDPATGQFLSRNRSGHPMFCAIPTMMEDGRVFVNGGDADSNRTSIFDYRTNQWASSDNMNTGRWYPGSVMLPGDKVFTMIGRPGGPYPEVWTEENGWSLLTGANLNNGVLNYTGYQSTWLPYLHLMPNGRVFHSGPTTQMNIIDPSGNGSITSAGLTNSWYPKYSVGVMYDEGKLLIAGGAANNTSTAPGTNQAMVIDFSGPTPTKTNIAPMKYARKFNNGVVLPNGEVLVIGGNTSGIEFSDQGTILAAEIWNPTTQSWREVADMSVPRNYHSVALLMTDGRVWSGGGGLCNCSADHMDHQVYSPPYLFNANGSLATRPTITAAPSTAQYGATLNVQASANIQKFSLIKMSGLTHNLNSDLRFLNVNFTTVSSGNYALTLHSNPNVLTPGYWMLFAINSQGVPSVAKVIQVLSSGAPQITPPGDQFSKVGDSVVLQISASDPNGDALTFSASDLPAGLTINGSGRISGSPSSAGVYNVTITVNDGQGGNVSTQFTWVISLPGGGSGQILREWWTGISGTAISSLTGNANYPNSPTGSDMLTSFEAPTDWTDNYGTRVRGYLHPPVTGQYRFWIASDDFGELRLSTDNNPANAVLIANVPGWSSPRQWNKYSQQQSALITLQGGQRYYIEALQKEGGGLDNLAVAWQMPGGAQEVITGQYLSPFGVENKYRYVRLVAESEVNGNPWTSAAEFNVLDSSGAVISRSGWTITADSQETAGESGSAANAIDGSTSTIWHTQWQAANPTHPHQITVDMGVFRTVGGFRYLPRQDTSYNGTIAAYKFYVSVDGVSWGQPVAQGTFATSKTEKTVTIDLSSSNEPPVLTAPGNQTHLRGEALSLSINASDPDGDTLTYSASGLPSGLAINNGSGQISGTPTTAGSSNVTVSVNDGNGGSDSTSFTWTIYNGLTLANIATTPKQSGTAVTYIAGFSGGSNPRFKWLFGDGTAETAYAASPSVSHTFAQPGHYIVTLTATDDSGAEVTKQFKQLIHRPLTAQKPAVSTSIVYEERTGNDRVWNVNPDNDTVSVIDAVTRQKVAEIAVGSAPRALAIAPDGRIWVTNKHDATISIINAGSLSVAQTVNLPFASQPYGLLFAPDGSAAYVTLEATGKLLKLNPSSGAQTGSADVGPNPRHLSMLANSSRVYVSRFISPLTPGEATANPQLNAGGGDVLVVNPANMSVLQTIRLQYGDRPDTEANGRGIPNYLGPAVISPDGVAAWVPSKQDNIARGVQRDGENLNFDHTVRSITSYIDLASNQEQFVNRIDHDNGGVASNGQFDRYGAFLFVALEGSRQVAVVDAYARGELFRIDVGRAPQGIAVSPDGQTLYVHNFMDRSVGIYDISTIIALEENSATTLATVNVVANEQLSTQVLLGKQIFYDAADDRLARDNYISCASCHNDGGQDGRVWDMTGFGEGLRNTIDLNGRAGMAHGLLHWSSNFDEVQDFENQIRGLAGGTGLMSDSDFTATQQTLGTPKAGRSAELDALAAYVSSLTDFDTSPHRNSNGTLTAAGQAGRTLFESKSCANCHAGVGFTDSAPNNLHDIGTLKPTSGSRLGGALTGIDTPTLRGVWSTAPYLHDGSAATLADAVAAHTNLSLSGSEITQLVAFLQQIDGSEAAPNGNQPPVITNPGARSNTVGESVNLAISASDPNGDSLTYSATGLPNGLSINSGSGVIAGTVTTAGSFNVTVSANDGRGGTDSESFTWSVNAPANQPPVITNPGARSNTVGESVSLTISASDPNGDSLSFSATGLPNGLSINSGSGVIAGTVTTAGSFNVTVSVNDGRGGSDSESFTWSVNAPANQPPVITNPGARSNTVGESVNLAISASDPNGDSLTYSATGLPNGLSINSGSGVIAGTVTTAGSFNVTVSVNDGRGGSDSESFTWSVNAPANQPPVITNPGARSNTVGESVSLTISASDPNGDSLTYSATGLPNGLSINSGSGVIAGTVTTAGSFNVTVSVNDGRGGTDSESFTWTVSGTSGGNSYRYVRFVADSEINGNPWASAAEFNVLGANGAPLSRNGWSVTASSQETAGEDGRAANVLDGDVTTIWHTQWFFATPSHPHWLQIDMGTAQTLGGFRYLPPQVISENGTVIGYKFYGSNNGANWTLLAQGQFDANITEKSVTLTGGGSNSNPTITNPGSQNSSVGASVNLTIGASDADGDSLTFSATGLPTGLTINSGSGVIAGTAATAGSFNATVSVSDGKGGAASTSFAWNVSSLANQPPTLSNPGNQNSSVGANINLTLSASDPNGDSLSFSATGLPTGLSINSSSGLISGVAGAAGSYNVTVSVNDGRGGADSESFSWSVSSPSGGSGWRYVKFTATSEINGNPWASAAELYVLDESGNAFNRSGWTITTNSQETVGEDGRAVNALDGDVNTIWHTQWLFTSPSHPHWLQIDMGSAKAVGGLRYLPLQVGSVNGTVKGYAVYLSNDATNWTLASQGEFAANQSAKTVLFNQSNGNQAPVLTNPGPRTNLVGDSVSLSVSASDADGDSLSFSASGLPAGLTMNSSGSISGAPATAGAYNVTVSVTDGNGGADSLLFTWTIQSTQASSCDGLVREAESGVLHGSFAIGSDAAASGGQYVHAPQGAGNVLDAPSAAQKVDLCFTVTQPGLYRIQGWIFAPSGNDDSFFVQVDGAPGGGYLWDTLINFSYAADFVNNRNGADPVEVNLSAGQHTVSVFLREDGTRLDKVALAPIGQATAASVDDNSSRQLDALGVRGQIHWSGDKGTVNGRLTGLMLTLVDAESGGDLYKWQARLNPAGEYYFDRMPVGDYLLSVDVPTGLSLQESITAPVTVSEQGFVEHDLHLSTGFAFNQYLPVVTR